MKVLIFTKNLPVKNIGGPCGYLYNIQEFLKKSPDSRISFYNKSNKTFIEKLDKIVEKCLKKLVRRNNILSFFITIYYMFYHKKRISKKEIKYIESFDYVHVHLAFEILQYFYKREIKTKVILTTHNPEPYVDEIADLFNCRLFLQRYPKIRNILIKREIKAYDLCDKIMFPAKEAREAYEISSDIFSDKFQRLDDKFFYVPTALGSTEMITENDHILTNIDKNSFKVCYIGRHNHVKGYDQLLKVAPLLWEDYPESHFIIGGKEGPLYGLNDLRWLELGWVNTSKLLNEVDVFVLPNKNTYFDLILIETLRQGTPIIASYTGGNKWYKNKSKDGIMFFEYGNIKELKDQLVRVIDLKKTGQLEQIKVKNREFCKEEFSMDLYIKRYINKLESFA